MRWPPINYTPKVYPGQERLLELLFYTQSIDDI